MSQKFKIFLSLVVIIIVVSVGITFYVLNLPSQKNTGLEQTMRYTLIITGMGQSIVYAPLIISDNGSGIPVKENYQMLISGGSGNISVITTPRGYAMKIESNGSLKLEKTAAFRYRLGTHYDHFVLSLQDNATCPKWKGQSVKYWWYLDSTTQNSDVSVSLYFTEQTTSGRSAFNGIVELNVQLTSGWSIQTGTMTVLFAD